MSLRACEAWHGQGLHDKRTRRPSLTAGPAQRTPSFVGQRTHDGIALVEGSDAMDRSLQGINHVA